MPSSCGLPLPQAMSMLSGVASMATCCAGLAATTVDASKNKKCTGNNYWYRDQPTHAPDTQLHVSEIAPTGQHSGARECVRRLGQ